MSENKTSFLLFKKEKAFDIKNEPWCANQEWQFCCLRQAQIQPWQLPITVLHPGPMPSTAQHLVNMGHLGKCIITKLGYIKTSFLAASLLSCSTSINLKLKLQTIRIYAMIVNSIKDESIVGAGEMPIVSVMKLGWYCKQTH